MERRSKRGPTPYRVVAEWRPRAGGGMTLGVSVVPRERAIRSDKAKSNVKKR